MPELPRKIYTLNCILCSECVCVWGGSISISVDNFCSFLNLVCLNISYRHPNIDLAVFFTFKEWFV